MATDQGAYRRKMTSGPYEVFLLEGNGKLRQYRRSLIHGWQISAQTASAKTKMKKHHVFFTLNALPAANTASMVQLVNCASAASEIGHRVVLVHFDKGVTSKVCFSVMEIGYPLRSKIMARGLYR